MHSGLARLAGGFGADNVDEAFFYEFGYEWVQPAACYVDTAE